MSSLANKYGEDITTATIHVARVKKGHSLDLMSGERSSKHHGSKSNHCYKNQILNRNLKGNFSKEGDRLTYGLAKPTTDKKRGGVQV